VARRRQEDRPARDAEERSVDWLAANVVRWIRAVAFVLGSTVAFLELRNAPLDRITQTFDNAALIKIGLVIFFFGWWWGATHDTQIQREGYCRDPKKGKIGPEEAAGILVFIAVFSLLFVLHDDPIWFQAFLLLFILVNTWTWRIIFRRTIPMIESTYGQFTADGDTRNNCSLAKLLTVVQYMNGPWQRRRFVALIFLAFVQLVVVILVESGSIGAYVAPYRIKGVSAQVLIGYLPGTLFILYVLISEIWMKIYRIKVFSDLETLDYLEDHFSISKRRDAALPQPHLAGLTDFRFTANRNYAGHGPLDWFLDTV
jgi:hypothetical protein